MTTVQSFPLFTSLPTELRLKIWSLILENPRTVEIQCEKGILENSARRYAKSFPCKDPVPPLLHVNRESRAEALAIYQLCFETPAYPATAYIAFDRDVVKMSEGVLAYLSPHHLEPIQSLVVNIKDSEYFAYFNMEIIRTLMPNLRILHLVVDLVVRASNWDRDYITSLVEAFTQETEDFPNWRLPNTRIIWSKTGAVRAILESGINPEESIHIQYITDI